MPAPSDLNRARQPRPHRPVTLLLLLRARVAHLDRALVGELTVVVLVLLVHAGSFRSESSQATTATPTGHLAPPASSAGSAPRPGSRRGTYRRCPCPPRPCRLLLGARRTMCVIIVCTVERGRIRM